MADRGDRLLPQARRHPTIESRRHSPLRDYQRNTGRVPPPWVEGGWFRYLNDEPAIEGAIDYVRQNPTRIDLPLQHWSFITPFHRVEQA
ncbi:MAG TPA: hypothetical protein VGI81_10765 [Tepidisphaeraceae bacterium]